MNLVNGAGSTERAADQLAGFRRRGIRLWVEHGQLRYAAPKGVLSAGEIEDLRAAKAQFVALLQDGTDAQIDLSPRTQLGPTPLTYSQRAHWNLYRLHERRAIRQVASATRLLGELDIERLRECLSLVVRRHEALRTRIVVHEGEPMQEIADSSATEFSVEDLAGVAEVERWSHVRRIIDEHILAPIDVAVGPLSGARLLRLRKDEHVLILALEHSISDAISLGILLRDILTAYSERLQSPVTSLPDVPIQLADYAAWQRAVESDWLRTQRPYWDEHLARCGRLRFPQDVVVGCAGGGGMGTIAIQIDAVQKEQLREFSRRNRTTLPMSIFAAYAALVLRWCATAEGIILFVTNGRVSPKLEHTLGFFAAPLYLRVGLTKNDTFADLAGRIMQEYCAASEHADHSYLSAHEPCAEFLSNTAFNWIPHVPGSHRASLDTASRDLECSPVAFTHPMLKTLDSDRDPGVQFYDADAGINGLLSFSLRGFSEDSMRRFGRNFKLMVDAMLAQPSVPISRLALV